jgi:hypothetical protein
MNATTRSQRGLKLWSVLIHLLAIAAGVAMGIASYHWVTVH